MNNNKLNQLQSLNYTWFSRAVASVNTMPYNPTDNFMRYNNKMVLTDFAGQHIQFIQKRWFPTISDDDEIIYIDTRYQYRPDVISVDYYNSPLYAWAILAVNGIRSVFELEAGRYIRIPNLAKVLEGLD